MRAGGTSWSVAPALASLTFAVLATLPNMARADASAAGASFVWDAPEGCPTSADVDAQIAQRVQRPRVRHAVRAFVVTEPSHVRVQLVDGEAERSIVAPPGEAAATAVAIIVALASDQDERFAAPAPPSAAGPPPAEADRPPAPLATGTPAGWRAALRGSAAFDSASLPQPSPGMAVGAEARRSLFSAGVTLAGFLAQTSRTGPRSVEASVGLFYAMVTACARSPVVSSVDLGACLGGGVGLLSGKSAGVANPGSGVGWRPQGELLGRAGFALFADLWLAIDGGLLVDPVRSPFRITNVGDVHRPSAVALRTSVGVEMRFR